MERAGHETAKMFVGTEVEHTPALGMRTLFVIGYQDPQAVVAMAQEQNCPHIYFGANQSFPNLRVNDGAEWAKWELMIYHWLEKDYWCTLDIDIQCVEGLLESGLTEHDRFIPMISAKIPYIQQLGYNAVLKIDDRDFRATNPGVWCHSIHQLQSRRTFTDWSKYTQDAKLG